MASSSGPTSRSSGSEEVVIMDQKKRKRMISNRESARRCRMRKQKHLDELTTQMAELKNENSQIVTAMNAATQYYVKFEAENSVLRAQVTELSRRLQSLSEIIEIANSMGGGFVGPPAESFLGLGERIHHDDFFNNGWGHAFVNNQLPLMASPNMFRY